MSDLDKGAWTFGISWNVVDDDGRPFKDVFNVNRSWNIPPYPSIISIEKFYRRGFSFNAIFAMNDYRSNKLINNHYYSSSNLFFSADLNAKFNFNTLYLFKRIFGADGRKAFDFYMVHGWGYTYREVINVRHTATLNVGFGLNIWIYKGFGVNLQSVAKFGIRSPFYRNPSNYLQHSFGIIYRFTPDPNNPRRKARLKRRAPQPSYMDREGLFRL